MTTLRGNERIERINTLKREGRSVSDIAKELGVSKPTVYNALKGGVKRKTTPKPISVKPLESALGMVSILQTGNDQAYVQIRVKSDQVARIVSKIFA